MAFCGKCGRELVAGDEFCQFCGASIASTGDDAKTQPAPTQSTAPPKEPPPRRYSWALWVIPAVLIVLFSGFFVCSFLILSLVGAQGQPSTVIPPSSSEAVTGNQLPIPKNLTGDAREDSIRVRWTSSDSGFVDEYKIYRSLTPGRDYQLQGEVPKTTTSFDDNKAKKGISYYYVVTAASKSGAESGNSNEAAAIIDSDPLIPKGIFSWEDVQKRANADPKYLALLAKVTGLTKARLSKLVQAERGGADLKTTLSRGTIITNSTKNYKILPNYRLKSNRIALTDENGNPYVLTVCGNPMKVQYVKPATASVIQVIQVTVINVINILPPTFINVIVNAAQPANTVVIAVLPASIEGLLGPTFAPLPPTVFIDPASLGDDYAYADADEDDESDDGSGDGPDGQDEDNGQAESGEGEDGEELPEGQQWIEEGKILIIADPPDPAPSQSVTMIIRLTPPTADVDVSYNVKGSDNYTDSGTRATDEHGEVHFTIPGGSAGVRDVIEVSVPSEDVAGSVEYQF